MKKKVSIYLTILLIVIEFIGLIITLVNNHGIALSYYTEDSNIFSLVISCIYLFYLMKDKVPKLVHVLKYMSVIGLTLTFLVVILILIPMYDFNFKWFLFEGDLLFFHLLAPIVAFISFVFFEEHSLNKKDSIYACSFTIIYSIVLIVLNIVNVVDGPYLFLRIQTLGTIKSIMWGVILFSLTYGISVGLRRLNAIYKK